MTAYLPDAEKVGIAWLKTNVAVLGGRVAGELPRDRPVLGFTTVQAYDMTLSAIDVSARRESVFMVDVWTSAANEGNKPPWGLAFQLAENIRQALDNDVQTFGATITLPPKAPDSFLPVRVLSAWLATEPRRIKDDPSAYARVTFDLAMVWCLA